MTWVLGTAIALVIISSLAGLMWHRGGNPPAMQKRLKTIQIVGIAAGFPFALIYFIYVITQ